MTLIAPYPWFGGKSRVAGIVWDAFGDVPNYVEPFFGSGAVLLGRPDWHRGSIETVNDLDQYVANFWRALAHDPDAVAQYADWPVNEADLFARHLWLVNEGRRQLREGMDYDPDWYDARIAGWWVWGISQWIGSGWCSGTGPHTYPEGNTGMGVSRTRPHLSGAGMGVKRQRLQLRDSGEGVHRVSLAGQSAGETGQLPRNGALLAYLRQLAHRLARVRVCCGDWTRILGPTPTEKLGITGVFLDPPYSAEANRTDGLYSTDDLSVAHDVREWAIANGDNPMLRIALCGYDTEHAMPDTWRAVPWKAHGGYAVQGNGNGRANAQREVVWFSPHCLRPGMTLFDLEAHG